MEQSIKYLLGHLQLSVELHIILHSSAVLVLSHAHNKTGTLQLQEQRVSGQSPSAPGDGSCPSSAKLWHWKCPESLDELQQASFSILNTRVLCAHHRPMAMQPLQLFCCRNLCS